MVPAKRLRTEYKQRKQCKHEQRYHLLNDFQLYQREWASVTYKSYPVCRHLKTVLEECYTPASHYHQHQRQRFSAGQRREFQMPVPCHCHKRIGAHEQQYRIKRFHNCCIYGCKDTHSLRIYASRSHLFFNRRSQNAQTNRE